MKKIFWYLFVLSFVQTAIIAQNIKLISNEIEFYDNNSSDHKMLLPVEKPIPVFNSPMALAGTYTIGTTSPGPNNYLNLSAAVADLQTQGVTGPVTFVFTDATYSDTSVVIGGYAGQGAANPVTFTKSVSVPNVKITFTGLRSFGVRLDSASYVSFIGSTTIGQRPITFEVDTAIARNPIVIVKSNNIRLEGLVISGYRIFSGASASVIFQSFVAGSTTPNTNLVYTNLLVMRGSALFNIGGISNTIRDNNVTLSNCDFGGDNYIETFSTRGISAFAINNLTIYKNDIRRGKNFSASTTGPAGIILFGGFDNLIISHNKIYDLEKYGTGTGQPTGIRVQSNGPGTYLNAKIFNNMIYDLRNPAGINASATQGVEGFAIGTAAANSMNSMEIFNNSIHLTGTLAPTTPSYSAALLVSLANASDTAKVYNNIISNAMIPVGSGCFAIADFAFQSAVDERIKANNNVYWYPANSLSIFRGANLTTWQTNTGEDVNSFNGDPVFVSTTDPHININSVSPANGGAVPVAYITDDIDLQVRSLTTPDIGADEYTYVAPSVLDPANFTASTLSTTQINLTFTKNGTNQNVVIVWNLTGTFSTPTGTPPAVGQPFAGGTFLANASTSPVLHSGLTSGTKYYYKAFSYDGIGNYSFGLTANATTLCDPLTLPYSESFDAALFPPSCWSLENAGLGNNWTRTATSTYSGAGAMRYSWNSTNPANAWAFTPAFNLQSGKTYRITFFQRVDGDTTYPEKMKVTVGNAPTSAAQTTVLWDNAGGINLTNLLYIERKIDYVCSVNGTYYFAFNCYSDADMYNLYVDEVSIIEKPTIDLSLNYFYQTTGLPIPKSGERFSDYSISVKKNSDQENDISIEKLNNNITGEKSNNINNTVLLDGINIPIELNIISLKGVIENRGLNPASYNLNWGVSGVAQTPYAGAVVNANAIDTATVTYNPSLRGTFLTTGNIVVTGDLVPANNDAQLRMRVYPDIYNRTIYDAGDNFVDTYVGWGSTTIRMKAGVRFTAGTDMKLAGVDFICRTETITAGEFEVQVRAAGTTTTAPGVVLYTQVFSSADYLADGEVGDYIHFPFGNDAPTIAAGSDYWITVKAPLGILYPGAVHNSGFTVGRSFYESDPDTTLWNALVLTTERAWIMRSVEVAPGPATFAFSKSVNNGWNMVSVPGLHPTDQNVTTWWSGKDPAAGVFRFNGGYVPVTTTTPGQGYWMKHAGAFTYNYTGIQVVAHDPILAATGWNLIGGYETNVATSGITTSPAGLQTGSVFQYGTGYTVATNLVPGTGYWIKLTGAGSINIPNTLEKGLAKTEVNTSDWGKIIITDKSGKSYTLYTVKGEVNLNDYELPPAPPTGMFDVRFGSGRYAEQLGSSLQTIELNSLEYPVRVRVENADIRLQDQSGSGLNERLKSGEEVVISNSSVNKLMVSGEVIPDKYALEQNYPNPFNPSTKIEFSIPEDVNNVTLTIYNALGQRVAELVNSKMEAGKYSYVWNASDVATGLYIYELRTDKFVSVKKMMLLK